MRFAHILKLLWSEPALITPAAHAAIRELVLHRIAHPLAERGPATDFCGEAVEMPKMMVKDGIAHIPIGGVIGHKLTAIERGYGVVDSADIASDIVDAMMTPEVHTLLFDIDSPGGMVNGTPELAGMLRDVREKRTIAWTDGEMASAAYYVASGAQEIYASPTAAVGSIGVYVPWLDSSAAMQAAGMKVDIIRSGPYKGMGFPGTSLSEEQRELLQMRVDEIAGGFKSFVAQSRAIPEAAMQGQVFSGDSALTNGFVDGIFPRKATMLAHLTQTKK